MAALSLFIAAFLAATILPFSSETAFVAALYSGMPLHTALWSASSGNILAIILNYALGYFLSKTTQAKLFTSKTGRRMYSLGHTYGYMALLLSWLPLIGDPLTLVAGLVRLRFVWFVIIAGGLRIVRYYLLSFTM
jgi:membrane protein YqaA with SNARE-associated domain